MKKIIGWSLLALPFILMFVGFTFLYGVMVPLLSFGLVGLLVACIVAGVNLSS